MARDTPSTLDDDAIGYVLEELEPEAARVFERRLAGDPALAAEVRRLRASFELMGTAAVEAPPPDLKARVMAASAPKPMPLAAKRVVWSRFAAAAAAMIAVVVGVDAYRLRSEIALERQMTATLQEPNVVQTFALTGAGGVGRVALDLDAKKGAMVLEGLPELEPGHVYRLWAAVGDRDIFCGDASTVRDGAAQVQFRVPVESYTEPIRRIFVTIEPEGTPTRPTGPTLMAS